MTMPRQEFLQRSVYRRVPTGVVNDLRRLEAKGYLRSKREGRAKIYVARVQPAQVVREVINDFVHRLFGGETIPLFQHLITDRGLTDAEIGQLREMLDRLENGKS